MEKEAFNYLCVQLELVSTMNFLRKNRHHINKDLYIRKTFESIYVRKKNG